MAKHDLGDMDRIRSELEAWLAPRLPGAGPLSLAEPAFPEASGESSVSLLLTALRDGVETRLVCRMQPPDSEVFDHHDLALQYGLMQSVGDAGVPVPGLLGYEADPGLLGSDFFIMAHVDGQVPTDNPPYAFGSWVTALSDAERSRMWDAGLSAMAAVHRIDPNGLQLPTLPRSSPQQAPMQHELDKFEAMVTPGLRRRLHPDLLAAIDCARAQLPSEGPRRLLWGDSRPGNVIWRDLAPAALIDWEMASLGDPLADASWWYWIDYVNSVGLGVERLGGLPSLEQVYRRWQQLTGLPTDHSAYFDLLSVTRYAIILEKKFDAMEAAGMGRIDNFALPFVRECLDRCG